MVSVAPELYYYVDMVEYENEGYEYFPVYFGNKNDPRGAELVAHFFDQDDADEYVDYQNEDLDLIEYHMGRDVDDALFEEPVEIDDDLEPELVQGFLRFDRENS